MLEKIGKIYDRYREIERSLSAPDVVEDREKFQKLSKEYADLSEIAQYYEAVQKLLEEKEELDLLAKSDDELAGIAEAELRDVEDKIAEVKEKLSVLLLPKDENEDRNLIVEIRAGTGGEEAALFASEIYRMYSMYAGKLSLIVKILHTNETELGGYKEITFAVNGKGAYSHFKYESGIHRVQRIPVTESNGKIQTSAVSVAVLPEAKEVEVLIKPADLHFESCKSSGAGGQHINKTESAVRLTHIPTGIVIECDSERSQFQNKDTALSMLRAKLYDIKKREQDKEIADSRKTQVGSGDRSEKIRTYNFPQSRVTDHRIGKTVYSLAAFLNGDMSPIIDELIRTETAEKLKANS